MTDSNTYITQLAATITNPIDFATPATDALRVQALMDVVAYEGTDPDVGRGFLDEMSPSARATLYSMLTELKANVSAV